MLQEIRKHWRFFVAAAIVLFLSVGFDVFGAITPAAFVQNFKDSEALVVNEVRCRGQYFAWQMAELKNPQSSNTQEICNPAELRAYSSQFGLQGRAYTFGYVVTDKVLPFSVPVGPYIIFAQLTTAALSALCLAAIVVWIRGRFGGGAAVVLTLGTALSPMLVGFGRNLYWVLPTMVLPLLATLYWYDDRATSRRQLLFWTAVGLLLYMRYLCGYEYLTSLTIMVAAVVGYHLWMRRAALRVYVWQFLTVLGVSLAAFGLALGTHVAGLRGPAGSAERALTIVKQRAMERTSRSDSYLTYAITGLKFNLSDQYTIADSYVDFDKRAEQPSQFWASLASVLNYLFMPVFTMPFVFVQPFATYVQSLAVFVLALTWLYVRRRRWVQPMQLRAVEALFVGAAIGLIGFLSWLVLARSHSLVHAHINGILLYLPFALFGFSIIGLYVSQQLVNFQKQLKGKLGGS
jgi:hypothetical protein